MTAKLNKKKYGELLAAALPKAIETEEEKERVMGEIFKLMDKGERATAEEEALLGLLSQLVEDYEAEHYHIEPAPPHIILQTLMEEKGLRQRDLLDIFKHSGLASEVINGKRGISKRLACDLAEFFNISPELFLWAEYQEKGIARRRRVKKPVIFSTSIRFNIFKLEEKSFSQVVDLQSYQKSERLSGEINLNMRERRTSNGTITSAA